APPPAPGAGPRRAASAARALLTGPPPRGSGRARIGPPAGPPPGTGCSVDLAAFNPYGELNFDADNDGVPDQLRFPPWLRNPDPAGGDLIPTTRAWEPFLYLNPANGTPYRDPAHPEAGLWSDLSFAFGEPLAAGADARVTVIAKRALPQALWIVDDLMRADGAVPVEMKD
ncbi:MAG: hypothetical protein H8E31_06790, partial [Planctomycetes bacterium]|nr:hypothetical protein [Planctomycetota bacterium]